MKGPFERRDDINGIKTPSIVVLANRCMYVRNCIRLSLIPCSLAYPLLRRTARLILEKSIYVLDKAINTYNIEDALRALGFKEITLMPYGLENIGIDEECAMGEVYTLVRPIGAELMAFLARCSRRGLKLYTSLFDLPGNALFMRRGDLTRELIFLSHIFDLKFRLCDRL